MELAGREHILPGKAVLDARNILAQMLAKIDAWLQTGSE